jgi:hypothetical protein
MQDSPDSRSPKHWRDMAEEARAMADGLATEANRQQMLQIAEDYERLAKQAQRELERSNPP